MKNRKLLLSVGMILLSGLLIQCSKDDDLGGMNQGTLTVNVTDAPSDDANIKGTFITVADVKVDGKSVEGFQRQTIEISAYQNGAAKLLLTKEMEAKSYNSISLVLDYAADASGKAPGCYVLTTDNKKHNLATEAKSQEEIIVSKAFTLESNMQEAMVVDFDLRRSVVREENASTETEYKFVTSAEMKNAIRAVAQKSSGEIAGEVNVNANSDTEHYVFVYKKGQFDSATESKGQGSSNVLFAKAITSSKVNSNGSFKLSYLEEGQYEVHVASFKKTTDANKTEFSGYINVSSTISGILLNSITVTANTQTTLKLSI